MAQAIKELWPEVKLAIGPSIEDGFYYDFDKKKRLAMWTSSASQKRCRRSLAGDEPFVREELDKAKAVELFKFKRRL